MFLQDSAVDFLKRWLGNETLGVLFEHTNIVFLNVCHSVVLCFLIFSILFVCSCSGVYELCVAV